jgi:hypothetical protein
VPRKRRGGDHVGRLAEALEAQTGVAFADRHVAVPNGLWPPAVDPQRWSVPARTFLWVSSDLPLIESEVPGFAAAIAGAVVRLGLEPVLLGRFPDSCVALFPGARHIPRLPFAGYRQFLRTLPAPLAIAPLPQAGGRHRLFIDSKSDIKVVDFQGHGVPALYSRTAPYSESDLKPPVLLDDDPAQWAGRLAELAAEPGRGISAEAVERVHATRAYARLAPLLGDVLDAACGRVSMPDRAVNPIFRRAERRLRAWRKRMTGPT